MVERAEIRCACGVVVRLARSDKRPVCPECGAALGLTATDPDPLELRSEPRSKVANKEKSPSRKPPKASRAVRASSRREGDNEDSEQDNDQPSTFHSPKKSKLPRKQRMAPQASATDSRWAEWFDPAVLLWLPLLIPALSMAFGSFFVSIALIPFRGVGGMMGILSFLAIIVPLSFLCRHLLNILIVWSMGDRRDPTWPDFDAADLMQALARWALAIIVTGVVFFPVSYWLDFSVWQGRELKNVLIRFVLLFFGGIYLSISLLLLALFDSVQAYNPWYVVISCWRLGRHLVGMMREWFLHLLVYFLYMEMMWMLWDTARAWDLGILSFILFWGLLVLASSRYMRALGMFYAIHAKRLHWFRG